MVRRSSAVVFVWFLLASPALAQPEVVASVKAELVARGVSLVDSCGGFQITKRVAWRLRATGAGLLSKPSGNQCEGYAVDIIAYADGRIVDILTDAGGQNGPTWGPGEPVEASRWRPAVDPGDSGPVVVPPVVVPPYQPPPVYTDLTPVYSRLDAMSAQLERMFSDVTARDNARAAQIAAVDQRLERHDNDPSWVRKFFTNSNTYVAVAGVLGGFLAKGAAK
jgi:hypothetical protein